MTRQMVLRGMAFAAAAATAFVLSTACSKDPVEDGASCDKDSDCKSGSCQGGACGGSECACSGLDCTSASGCQDGWVCKRGSVGADYEFPHCKKSCATQADCPSATHCSSGVCEAGDVPAEPLSIAWVSSPEDRNCYAKQPCTFTVEVSGGSGKIDHYEWLFGADVTADAGVVPTVTNDPTTSRVFSSGGSFDVKVTAFDSDGAQASLTDSQSVCITGGSNISCTPGSSDECCSGLCQATADPNKGVCP